MQPTNSTNNLSASITSAQTTIVASTVATSSATNTTTANISSPRSTPPRLIISTSVNNASNLPTSPRPMLSPRTVPQSSRLLNSKNSPRVIEAEKNNPDAESSQPVPASMLTPKSLVENYKDNPPPYTPVNTSSQSLSPTKLSNDSSTIKKNELEKNELPNATEPVLSPRRSRLMRHTPLQRNSVDLTGKIDHHSSLSPRITSKYAKTKIVTALSHEITKSITDGKPAKTEIIQTLGRGETYFNVDELPEELQSLCDELKNKKIPSTKLIRDLFLKAFKSTPAWEKIKEYIDGAKLMSDPSINFGDADENIKEKKLMILKPLAEDIVNCIFGNSGLIFNSALPDEFIDNFLFQADQKILEWALKSPNLDIKKINLARCLFLYNLVVVRFISPIITAEFGDKPSQMDSWMQSLIMTALGESMHKIFVNFLEESVRNMPDSLVAQLNAKASMEIKNKRIAAFKDNSSSKNKSVQNKLVEMKLEKNKLKIEKENLALVESIKKESGIDKIQGNFLKYIQSDIDKWLISEEKVDRETVILNLKFAIDNYPTLDNDVSSENLVSISSASKVLDRLIKNEITESTRRHTVIISEDFKSILNNSLAPAEQELTIVDKNTNTMQDKVHIISGTNSGSVVAPKISTTTTTKDATGTTANTTFLTATTGLTELNINPEKN